jgi:hypothetical protein
MIEPGKRSSLLERVSAGVKAVAIMALVGTIALAALASHRGEAPLSEHNAVSSTTATPAMSVPAYLGKAGGAATETRSAE